MRRNVNVNIKVSNQFLYGKNEENFNCYVISHTKEA